ncbi:hypothetical protein L6452_44534 [Arctium lappa]|uniref:Uncharacterized protein n=1 Tax=Arctium lappa TaxID=4217 RepID=A0ACB8XGD8_ARCLA|nr:hypothetical protein L6452_44534 [Arctium lappa]
MTNAVTPSSSPDHRHASPRYSPTTATTSTSFYSLQRKRHSVNFRHEQSRIHYLLIQANNNNFFLSPARSSKPRFQSSTCSLSSQFSVEYIHICVCIYIRLWIFIFELLKTVTKNNEKPDLVLEGEENEL